MGARAGGWRRAECVRGVDGVKGVDNGDGPVCRAGDRRNLAGLTCAALVAYGVRLATAQR